MKRIRFNTDYSINILDPNNCYIFILHWGEARTYYMGEIFGTLYRFIHIRTPFITKGDYVIETDISVQGACTQILHDCGDTDTTELLQFNDIAEAAAYLCEGT